MDSASAKVLGSIALVFGFIFVAASVVRLTRPEGDVLLVLLTIALGALWLGAGVWLWRSGASRRPPNEVAVWTPCT
ncbi:hypothetical protein [Curtobacterium sp. 20TX0008]|uniref:hypothetical protein n=1 Tax=Curtobacterium sp. 20TX0008 TaxID=3022018 RepID=UPI0023306269|nr:hypothetical protein [Curtobacterium sp. 20TX0008]MDB6427113.1 hypothetical protein [Curtobacterium sp. 20TX0008]